MVRLSFTPGTSLPPPPPVRRDDVSDPDQGRDDASDLGRSPGPDPISVDTPSGDEEDSESSGELAFEILRVPTPEADPRNLATAALSHVDSPASLSESELTLSIAVPGGRAGTMPPSRVQLLEEIRESRASQRRRTAGGGTSRAAQAPTSGQRTGPEVAPPAPLGAPRPPPPPPSAPPRVSPARSSVDRAHARAVLQPVVTATAPGVESFQVEDAATYAYEAVQRWLLLANAYEASQVRVGALTHAMEVARRSHQTELEGLRREWHVEVEGLRGELSRAVPTFLASKDFRTRAMSYARDHMAKLVEEWLASDEGRRRVATESYSLYEAGRYVMQEQIYRVLREQDSTFDPVSRGLPEVEPNPEEPSPDLTALDSPTLTGGNRTLEEPIHVAALDRYVAKNPLPAGTVPPDLEGLQFPGTLEEYAAECQASDAARGGSDAST